MPTYPIKCDKCRFTGDVYAKVSELDAKGRLLCPECGERAEQDYGRKSLGVVGDDLHGKRRNSVESGAMPHEVPELRRLYGDSGKCWQNDGSVKFDSKTDAAKFYRKEQALKRKFAAEKKAKAGKAK